MKNLRHILVSGIVLSASMLNLSGCGQTGPLYLPGKALAPDNAATPHVAHALNSITRVPRASSHA